MHAISILKEIYYFYIYVDCSSETKVTATLQWVRQGSFTEQKDKSWIYENFYQNSWIL